MIKLKPWEYTVKYYYLIINRKLNTYQIVYDKLESIALKANDEIHNKFESFMAAKDVAVMLINKQIGELMKQKNKIFDLRVKDIKKD